ADTARLSARTARRCRARIRVDVDHSVGIVMAGRACDLPDSHIASLKRDFPGIRCVTTLTVPGFAQHVGESSIREVVGPEHVFAAVLDYRQITCVVDLVYHHLEIHRRWRWRVLDAPGVTEHTLLDTLAGIAVEPEVTMASVAFCISHVARI